MMESRFDACFLLFSFLLLSSTHLFTSSSYALSTISSGKSLLSNQTLISRAGNFELGFFRPGNSLNYYLGIWFNKISVRNRTVVWVANRDSPLKDPTSSEFKLSEDGNLVLLQNQLPVWSTSLTQNSTGNSSEAVLGDDGNFVLRNVSRPSDIFWQSFDHPTNTFLPGGRIGYDNRTKKSQVLTSWKNVNDPSMGLYSLQLDPNSDQFVIRWNLTQSYWTSGSWNGTVFSDVPEMRLNYIYNFSYVKNANESYFTYSLYNTSLISMLVMDFSGQIKQSAWLENSQQWNLFWSQPRQQCQVYSYCGAFGICNENSDDHCECMDGFEPRSPQDWYLRDYSNSGCVRRACGDKDDFSLMTNTKYPVNEVSVAVASGDKCRSACLKTCSCTAYAYTNSCLIWNGDLSGLQQLSLGDPNGNDLYLRLAASEFSKGKNKVLNTGVIVGVVAAALVFILGLIVIYVALKRRSKMKGIVIKKNQDIASFIESGEEDIELPLFKLVTIETATDNLSITNKIGEGGFGPVYKGVLPTGQEIAIKRLSKKSRQGREEFMNEVILIAKLQHRNLVRLLGCCIQGDERMLIYEYMPNGSLDSFLFDKTRSCTLNWKVRLHIIYGITRGLLYLHHDSILRVIHRDLKASNILLDRQMNPKISDFGMARIFGGEQVEENTRRVVGTYGYMSPEYATDGLFSMKSDVFSFGVLVLEIISGKRNRLFHHADHDLNLLGHAWKLLNENNGLELMDSLIRDSAVDSEVLKCIQVSLLCVQKFPKDRPTMSSVLSMLDSDGASLPLPKLPGFYTERSPLEVDSSSLSSDKAYTGNDATVTLLQGR